MVVVDEVVDVVDVEEGEGSRMAYFECVCEKLPPVFRLKSVYLSVPRALRGTVCDFLVCECNRSLSCILKSNGVSLRSFLWHISCSYEEDEEIAISDLQCIQCRTIIVHDF